MNTCEMLKAIGGTNKVFIDQFGNRIDFADDGYLCWNTGQVFMITRDILESSEWEEVKESIGLVELLEKISREGDITVDFEDYKDEYNFKDTSLDEVLLYLSKEFSGDCLAETLLASKWYIRD